MVSRAALHTGITWTGAIITLVGYLYFCSQLIWNNPTDDVLGYLSAYAVHPDNLHWGLMSSETAVRETVFLRLMIAIPLTAETKHFLLCSILLIYLMILCCSNIKGLNNLILIFYIIVAIGPTLIVNFPRQILAALLIIQMARKMPLFVYLTFFLHAYTLIIYLLAKTGSLAASILRIGVGGAIMIYFQSLFVTFQRPSAIIDLIQFSIFIAFFTILSRIFRLDLRSHGHLLTTLCGLIVIAYLADIQEMGERLFVMVKVLILIYLKHSERVIRL